PPMGGAGNRFGRCPPPPVPPRGNTWAQVSGWPSCAFMLVDDLGGGGANACPPPPPPPPMTKWLLLSGWPACAYTLVDDCNGQLAPVRLIAHHDRTDETSGAQYARQQALGGSTEEFRLDGMASLREKLAELRS